MNNAKKVILFGAGQIGGEALRYFGENRVSCFVDNNEKLAGQKIQNIPVISFQQLQEIDKDYRIVISVSAEKVFPIAEQLEAAGIRQYEIFLKILQGELKKQVAEITAQKQKKYLVICNGGYPMEGNPRCIFAHERVKQYIKAGLNVDVFGFILGAPLSQYKFDGVDVTQGGVSSLRDLLKSNHYEKLLIHFADLWVLRAIQEAGKLDMPMIVWCHGYGVLPWYRCWFNYSREQIERSKKNLYQSDILLRNELKAIYSMDNIHFVFVSAELMERSKKFVGNLPKHHSVIHNYIDCEFFASPAKKSDDRFRILSIKNHATRMYANDLTAKAILELSEREIFSQLTFELYGDGILFEDNYGELMKKNFPNVHIYRKCLTHHEMRDLFCGNGIFLSPTRRDTQGVTSCEAMAAGMAVVTSSVGAVPEFIDEDCGSLFEYDNYWMMAEDIEYLCTRPDEFLRKSRNAVQRVRTQCGYEQTIGKELQLITGA